MRRLNLNFVCLRREIWLFEQILGRTLALKHIQRAMRKYFVQQPLSDNLDLV